MAIQVLAMTVKFKLAEVRKIRGLSQNALAKAAGMTLQNVQHLERKAKSLPLTTLDNLCNVLKCTPADLLEYTPDPSSENLTVEVSVEEQAE